MTTTVEKTTRGWEVIQTRGTYRQVFGVYATETEARRIAKTIAG